MNPQTIILGIELAQKAIHALQLVHQGSHPKNVHDEVSNIIHAIVQAAKPAEDIPAPAETNEKSV